MRLRHDKQPQEKNQNDLLGIQFQPGNASRFLDEKRKEWTVLWDLHVELLKWFLRQRSGKKNMLLKKSFGGVGSRYSQAQRKALFF